MVPFLRNLVVPFYLTMTLVYKVIDTRLVVQVIAIGRRDQNTVYKLAHNRLS